MFRCGAHYTMKSLHIMLLSGGRRKLRAATSAFCVLSSSVLYGWLHIKSHGAANDRHPVQWLLARRVGYRQAQVQALAAERCNASSATSWLSRKRFEDALESPNFLAQVSCLQAERADVRMKFHRSRRLPRFMYWRICIDSPACSLALRRGVSPTLLLTIDGRINHRLSAEGRTVRRSDALAYDYDFASFQ